MCVCIKCFRYKMHLCICVCTPPDINWVIAMAIAVCAGKFSIRSSFHYLDSVMRIFYIKFNSYANQGTPESKKLFHWWGNAVQHSRFRSYWHQSFKSVAVSDSLVKLIFRINLSKLLNAHNCSNNVVRFPIFRCFDIFFSFFFCTFLFRKYNIYVRIYI